jgi:hypothetical protein
MSSLAPQSLRRLGRRVEWLDTERWTLSLTYCGWPACGRPTFPHHLNKLDICYSTNWWDDHINTSALQTSSNELPRAATIRR